MHGWQEPLRARPSRTEGLATNHYNPGAEPYAPVTPTYPHPTPPCPHCVDVPCLDGTICTQ